MTVFRLGHATTEQLDRDPRVQRVEPVRWYTAGQLVEADLHGVRAGQGKEVEHATHKNAAAKKHIPASPSICIDAPDTSDLSAAAGCIDCPSPNGTSRLLRILSSCS
jgi:hypothetical protein